MQRQAETRLETSDCQKKDRKKGWLRLFSINVFLDCKSYYGLYCRHL